MPTYGKGPPVLEDWIDGEESKVTVYKITKSIVERKDGCLLTLEEFNTIALGLGKEYQARMEILRELIPAPKRKVVDTTDLRLGLPEGSRSAQQDRQYRRRKLARSKAEAS